MKIQGACFDWRGEGRELGIGEQIWQFCGFWGLLGGHSNIGEKRK